MKRLHKSLLLLSLSLVLAGCSSATVSNKVAVGSMASWTMEAKADYLLNYSNISFTLGDMSALSDDMLFFQQDIPSSGKLTPPETNPVRANYTFTGWYKDSECASLFDFASEQLTSSVFLYAGWEKTGEATYVEPKYTPSENIDDTLTSNLELTGLLNTPAVNGDVALTTGGLLRLAQTPADVSFALNYKKKTGTSISSAVYSASLKTVTVTSANAGVSQVSSLTVSDASSSFILSNSTYESKALAFEKADADKENYHVMLAGSSSIEFWTDYANALSPIVTYSHGIGGTTSADWNNSLFDRLVAPYAPKAVVYYVGVNDLVNSGYTNDAIVSNVEALINKTHERLPNTHIFYVLINVLPGYYLSYSDRIKAIDASLTSFISPLSYAETIDAGAALMKKDADGNLVADAAYFRLDNLHMSEYGYVLWGKEIKKALMNWMG